MSGKWQVKALGDVCELATGGTPNRSRPEFFGGHIPWLVSGDINQREILACEGRITDAGLGSCNAKLLPRDSVMIALNGQGKTRATVAMLRIEAACNQSLVCIFPKDRSTLLPEFVFANLHGRYEELRRMTSDDDKDRRGLNMGIIRRIKIPVPTIAEQRRLVALLDEAFADIAIAKANAEKNLQNARALFVAFLGKLFADLKANRRRLGDITEVQSGGTPMVSEKRFWDGGIPWYASGELNHFTTSEPERTLSEAGIDRSNAKLFPAGSLLIGMYDTAALKMSILDREAAFNQAIAGAKPSGAIDTRFLLHAISAQREKLLGQRRGVRQKNLSLGKIKDIIIPLPSMKVQAEVVAKLNILAEDVSRFESVFRRKYSALDELKQSLLARAFAGEL